MEVYSQSKARDAMTIRKIFNQFLAIVKSIRLKSNEPMRVARNSLVYALTMELKSLGNK